MPVCTGLENFIDIYLNLLKFIVNILIYQIIASNNVNNWFLSTYDLFMPKTNIKYDKLSMRKGCEEAIFLLTFVQRWFSQSDIHSGGDDDATLPSPRMSDDVQPPNVRNEPLLSSDPPFAEGREAFGQWDTFST